MPDYRVRYRARGHLRDGEQPITTWIKARNAIQAATLVRECEPDVSYIVDVTELKPAEEWARPC